MKARCQSHEASLKVSPWKMGLIGPDPRLLCKSSTTNKKIRSKPPSLPFAAVLFLLFLPSLACSQHYCWPCAVPHGVIGKWTNAASDAPSVYEWLFRYLDPTNACLLYTSDAADE